MTDDPIHPRRRLDMVLDAEFLADIAGATADNLAERRKVCRELENELSFIRRLSQARIEIVSAEFDRRKNGGSVGDLIAALPRILADDFARSGSESARVSAEFAPSPDIEWTRGLERLVSDSTLANLPTLTESELAATLAQLRDFEAQTSETRRRLHRVLDELDLEMATRHKVDQD